MSQGVNVIYIKLIQHGINAIIQATLLEKLAVGICRGSKAAGNRDTGVSQVTDHFAEGCIFAPDPLYIVDTQVLEGHYVL